MTEVFDMSKVVALKKFHTKEMNKECNKDHLTSSLAIFVEALYEKEFNSQQKLSDYLGCNKAHTSRTLSKLQDLGLIDPLTSRNCKIVLTEKGKDLAITSRKIKLDVAKKLFHGIDEEDIKTFVKVLDKVFENASTCVEEGE